MIWKSVEERVKAKKKKKKKKRNSGKYWQNIWIEKVSKKEKKTRRIILGSWN